MTVNATTDDSLVIKGINDSAFGSIGTTTISRTTLHPATSKNGVDFAKLGAAVKVERAANSAATWSGTSGAFTAGSDFTTGDLVTATNDSVNDEYYYLEASYTIKALGNDQAVYLKDFTLTSSSTLKEALRMSVTLNGTTKVFNIGAGAATQVGTKGSTAWELDSPNYTAKGTTAATFGTLTANTEYTATIRVWFEGQDTSCYTDHVDDNDSVISCVFTSDASSLS